MYNLLFDYDGTLHDCLHIYAPAVRAVYSRMARQGLVPERPLPDTEIRSWIGLTPDEMWGLLAPDLPAAEKEAAGAQVGQHMLQQVRAGRARLYPGVHGALAALRADGFRLLLLSNCPADYLQAHAACFGLGRYFEGLYCGAQFGYRPKHEIFSTLRKRYPGPFAVIGDRRQDMEIALRHSLPAVGCLYGYGGPGELAGADLTVTAPGQLPDCLRQLAG